jgi:signal transduction histidine kinase
MRERVALLNGRFELLSDPGQGVTIRAEMPCPKE